jgi:hypothetical protein
MKVAKFNPDITPEQIYAIGIGSPKATSIGDTVIKDLISYEGVVEPTDGSFDIEEWDGQQLYNLVEYYTFTVPEGMLIFE